MDLWKDIDALLAILYVCVCVCVCCVCVCVCVCLCVCVFATVNLSHALPRGKRGVGGLGIQQSQKDLVLPENHWWSHNELIIQDYIYLLAY